MRPARIEPVAVVAQGIACATGLGLTALADAVRSGGSALRPNDFSRAALPAWIGRIESIESTTLPPALQAWDCRATRAAWLGLQAD